MRSTAPTRVTQIIVAFALVIASNNRALAQDATEMPPQLPRLDATSTARDDDAASAQSGDAAVRAYPLAEHPSPQGAFWSEVMGGVAGLGIGLIPMALFLGGGAFSDKEAPYTTELVVTTLVASPILIVAGVTLAGNSSGGDGSVFGALLGEAIGLGLFAVTARSMLANGFLVASWCALTTIGGAVVGYRLSAPDEPDAFATISPPLDGRGAMFSLSGVM